jgi:hypothetical protein
MPALENPRRVLPRMSWLQPTIAWQLRSPNSSGKALRSLAFIVAASDGFPASVLGSP